MRNFNDFIDYVRADDEFYRRYAEIINNTDGLDGLQLPRDLMEFTQIIQRNTINATFELLRKYDEWRENQA